MKANRLTLYLVFFAFLTRLEAQIPTSYNIFKTAEDEFTSQICYTPSGEMLVGGYTGSNQEAKAVFLKKIQEPGVGGAIIWQKQYDNPAVVEALRDMKVAPDGDLLLLVEQRINWNFGSLNSANCLLLKVNPDGAVVWKVTFNGGQKDIPVGIEVLADGSYLLLGSSNSNPDNNNTDVLLWLPITADGVVGTPKYLAISAFAFAPLSDVALAPDGSLYTFNGFQIVKFDPNANIIWEKPIGVNLIDRLLTRLYIKQDGSVLIAGGASIGTSPEKLDAVLLHYSADGAFIWQQTYGSDGIEIIEELIVCEEEGKIVCVGQDSPNDLVLIDGYYFLVTDMAGNEISSTTIGSDSPSFELGLDLTHTLDGRVVAAGTTTEFGTRDVMLLYTDELFFSCTPPGMSSNSTEPILASVRISPNPTIGDFRVFQADKGFPSQSQFSLFNALGKLVYTQKIDKTENEVSGLNLSPGIYFYKINHESRTIGTGKLVVAEY